MNNERFERQIRLFGEKGQKRIRNTHAVVVGAGGLGSHVIQQLSFLGIGGLTIVDPDELEKTNLNRLIGARHDDPIPGTKKVDIAERLVNSIDPSIKICAIDKNLREKEVFSVIKEADCVFGCVDNDGSRLMLNELCSAFEILYLDLASDITKDGDYGGRVFINFDNKGCLCCYDEISPSAAAMELESSNAKKDRKLIYGVSKEHLDATGPSVVSIDGVVASLAVTKFMLVITGIRPPNRLLKYYANKGIVCKSLDKPSSECFYCKTVRGSRDGANVDRYCTFSK